MNSKCDITPYDSKGLAHGYWVIFNPDGSKHNEINYDHGAIDGFMRIWFSGGGVMWDINVNNKHTEGECILYGY